MTSRAWRATGTPIICILSAYSRAIEGFTLLALLVFLAYNLFQVFLIRNRKPHRRRTETESFWAALITAQICSEPGKHLELALPGVGFYDDLRVSAFSSKATKGLPLLNPEPSKRRPYPCSQASQHSEGTAQHLRSLQPVQFLALPVSDGESLLPDFPTRSIAAKRANLL
jgi:hypothetical protein